MGMIEEGHIYSYSQLSQFDDCPYSYYLQRIEGNEDKQNAFSQYGKLMHSVIERWANGDIEKEDMVDTWAFEYRDIVTERWPIFLASKGYDDKAFQAGVEYLENFDGFEGYTVLGVEEKFEIDLCGRPFVGVIDMILRNNETGEIVLMDHKSKSKAQFKKNAQSMYKQLYIYSKYVYEKYGEYPAVLRFNLFKERIFQQKKFSGVEYNECIQWANNIMDKIESYDVLEWMESRQRDFFCQNVCGVRSVCQNGQYLR